MLMHTCTWLKWVPPLSFWYSVIWWMLTWWVCSIHLLYSKISPFSAVTKAPTSNKKSAFPNSGSPWPSPWRHGWADGSQPDSGCLLFSSLQQRAQLLAQCHEWPLSCHSLNGSRISAQVTTSSCRFEMEHWYFSCTSAVLYDNMSMISLKWFKIDPVPVCFSAARIKHPNQKQLREGKGLLQLES